MKGLEEKLEMKVKDCYNTNTIFDKRKYVLLSDAKKTVNEALSIANVVNRRELLLDFADYSERDKTSQTTDECVDNYLDSIK